MKLVHHVYIAVSHVGDYACIYMYAVHNMFVHCVLSVNLNTHLVYANIQNIVCFIAYTAIVDSTLVLVKHYNYMYVFSLQRAPIEKTEGCNHMCCKKVGWVY